MPLLDGIRIVASNIHGYGGVTTKPFSKGDTLCFGDGVLYAEDDDFDDTYALILDPEEPTMGDTVFWDLVCQTRWFNHSCDPNTDVLAKWNKEKQRVDAWWVALRDIPVGEEITYDYAFAADVAEPCACGAATCRGLIVDDAPENLALLSPELRAKLR
jgi:hypothetical protein